MYTARAPEEIRESKVLHLRRVLLSGVCHWGLAPVDAILLHACAYQTHNAPIFQATPGMPPMHSQAILAPACCRVQLHGQVGESSSRPHA